MSELVIITAAGWKGSGINIGAPPGPDICYPLAGCPEPFLPVGNGETSLSRLVRQFSDLGFQDFAIGIAEPGYQMPPPTYHHGNVLGDDFTPWTRELSNYAAQFGEVVTMPDPYSHTHWHTAATVLEKCGQGYNAALILFGDYVFSDKFAKLVAAMPRPAELLESKPNRGSTMYWLDAATGAVFIKEAWRDWDEHVKTDVPFRRERRGAMKQALREAGMPSIFLDKILACSGFHWRDIDTSPAYARILEQIASFGESKTKIHVCGFPRSGTVWLARLIGDMLRCPIHIREFPEGLERQSNFSVHHSHALPAFFSKGDLILRIVRDPRDVAVSQMKYFRATLDERMGGMCADYYEVNGGGWHIYEDAWFESGIAGGTVRYEDLLAEPEKQIETLLEALGIQYTTENLSKIIEYRSFEDELRRQELVGGRALLWRGQAGTWTRYFYRALGARAENVWGSWMERWDYTRAGDWWESLPDGPEPEGY